MPRYLFKPCHSIALVLLCGLSGCGGGSQSTGAPPQTFSIQITSSDGGSSSHKNISMTSSDAANILFTPSTGYSLATVNGCNGQLQGNQYTIRAIQSNCTIHATFKLNTYTITASANIGGELSQQTIMVEHGNVANLQVTPHNGFRIDNVSGCSGQLNGNQFSTGNITANCSITATFSPIIMHKVAGKVIDGYVRGATVWLDINGNRLKDNDEPSAVSTQAGDYALELTDAQRDCAAYSAIYVDVPVGAIDEDSGVVNSAYQMSRPPQLHPLSTDDLLHISPLTTLLQQQIIDKYQPTQQQTTLSCADLKANQAQLIALRDELQTIVRDVVQKYNISAEQIFADFINQKNPASYQLAQSIVQGLKASYQYRETLKRNYPTATYIRTMFYQGSSIDNNNAYPKAWYRDTAIWLPSGFISELVKMNDDMATVARPIILREAIDKNWQNAVYTLQRTTFNYLGDDHDFRCSAAEYLTYYPRPELKMSISNSAETAQVKDPTACDNIRFQNPDWRYYEVSYNKDGVHYGSYFSIHHTDPEFNQLKDWIDFKDKAGQLDLAVVTDRLAAIGYVFEETPTIAIHSWHKRSTDDRSKNRVQIDRYSSGKWTKKTTQDDQTIKTECSDDGMSWTLCAAQ